MIPCTTWSFNLLTKVLKLFVVDLSYLRICDFLDHFTTTPHNLSPLLYFHQKRVVFIWIGILAHHRVENILHFACLFGSRLY